MLSDQELLTTVGDLFYMNTGPSEARLPIGATDRILTVVSGKPAWADLAGRQLPGSALRGYIDGFRLSRNSATVLDVGAGVAISEDASRKCLLELTGTETVTLTVGGSSPGTVGGLDAARATNTWYHVFAIYKDSDGTTDGYADTSVTAANKPTGYSSFRRLGSFRTDATGSGEITAFSQFGDEFLWADPPLDVDDGTPGTSAVSRALTVPLGVKTWALFNAKGDFTEHGGYSVEP